MRLEDGTHLGEAEGEGEGEGGGGGGGGSEAEAWTAAAELAKLGSLTLLASHRSDWRGGEGMESSQAAKQGMEFSTEDSAVGSGSGTGAAEAEAEAAIALQQAIKTAVAAICRGASEDLVRRGR